MPDEDIVFDYYAFTDERVTGDLHVSADAGIFLDFDKGPDTAVVSNRAAVEVDECVIGHVAAKLYVRGDTTEFHFLFSGN